MQTWIPMSKTMSPAGKQALLLVIVSGAIFSSFVIGAAATNQLSLVRPRWNVPSLVLANETITIEAETSFPLAQVGDLSAQLVSPLGTFPLVLSASPVQSLNTFKVVASFPLNVTKDILYDLRISVGGLTDIQRHAVKVLSAYKQDFKVIVWTDTQVGYSSEYEDVWENTYLFIEEMVNQANLINPEFVWVLGDTTETSLRSEYQFMYDQYMRLNVPVFVGPGNHDCYDTAEYRRWCRYFNYTFDYGPDHHFVFLDTGMNLDALRTQYYTWLQGDLADHATTPVKIVAAHAAPYQCSDRDMTRINKNFEYLNAEFVSLMNDYNVSTYVHGHDHLDQNKYASNCTLVPAGATPTSLRMLQTASGREAAAYRVLQFEGTHLTNVTSRINSTTFERSQRNSLRSFADTGPTNDRPDITKPNLLVTVNASGVNDITSSAVAAVECNVTSRFPEKSFDDFTNMTVRFTISSTANPAAMYSSNQSSSIVAVTAVKRIDVVNAWWVEVTFNLANGEGISIKLWGA
jgi:3',5'-cyclic AMP phosphodiesterase CpdA